jgi:phosphoenolpyruvate carboxylase
VSKCRIYWLFCRQEFDSASEKLRNAHVGACRQPSSAVALRHLRQTRAEFRETIASLNSKINRLNMIVPLARQQRVHYDADRECQRIANESTESTKPSDNDISDNRKDSHVPCSDVDRTTLRDVLKEIKALFHKSS